MYCYTFLTLFLVYRRDSEKLIALEIFMMKTSHHPNIVLYIDTYRVENELWIVMEFIDGFDLTTILDCYEREETDSKKRFSLTEPQMAHIFLSILKALSYLHAMGRIHRDVKSDNTMVTKEGEVKLGEGEREERERRRRER